MSHLAPISLRGPPAPSSQGGYLSDPRLRWWVVSGLAALSGCSSTEVLRSSATPDDLTVWAVLESSSEPRQGGVETRGEPIRVELEKGEQLVLAVIPRQDLVHPDGRPLEPVEIDEARWAPGADAGGHGSCGRCLVPALSAPQSVSPGDRCAPPSFVEVSGWRAENGRLARLESTGEGERSALAIAWPGSCPCSAARSAPAPRGRFEVCLVDDPLESISPISMGLAEDGAVSGLGEGFWFYADATGRVLTRQLEPAIDNLLGHAVLEGGQRHLMLGSTGRGKDARSDLRHLDAQLNPLPIAGLPPETQVSSLSSDGPDAVFLFGTVRSTLTKTAVAHRCVIPASGLASCTEVALQPDDGCQRTRDEASIQFRTILDGGDEILAAKSPISLYLRPAGASELYCAPSWPSTLPLADLSLTDLEAVGRRIFVCAKSGSGINERGFVLSGELPPVVAQGDRIARPFPFVLEVEDTEDAPCVALFADADRPNHALAAFVPFGGRPFIVGLDDSGLVAGRWPGWDGPAGLFPDAPFPIEEVDTSRRGFVAIRSASGESALRAPGGRFSILTRLPGPLEQRPRALASMEDGRVIAFAGSPEGGVVIRSAGAEAGCEGLTREPLRLTGSTSSSAIARAAARDHRSEDAFIVVGDSGPIPWVRKVDLAAGTFVEQSYPELAGTRFFRAVELTPGVFLLLDGNGGVWSIRNDGAPATLGGGGGWRSLDARAGAAWIGGDGALGRIVSAGGADLKIEDTWLSRLRKSELDGLPRSQDPVFDSIAAFCADDVFLEAFDFILGPGELGETSRSGWEIIPAGGDGLELVASPAFDRTALAVANSAERSIRIIGERDRPSFIYRAHGQQACVFRPGADRSAAPFPLVRDAASGSGFIVIADEQGRLVVGLDHAP